VAVRRLSALTTGELAKTRRDAGACPHFAEISDLLPLMMEHQIREHKRRPWLSLPGTANPIAGQAQKCRLFFAKGKNSLAFPKVPCVQCCQFSLTSQSISTGCSRPVKLFWVYLLAPTSFFESACVEDRFRS